MIKPHHIGFFSVRNLQVCIRIIFKQTQFISKKKGQFLKVFFFSSCQNVNINQNWNFRPIREQYFVILIDFCSLTWWKKRLLNSALFLLEEENLNAFIASFNWAPDQFYNNIFLIWKGKDVFITLSHNLTLIIDAACYVAPT